MNSGDVILGNNKTCKIRGIGNVRLKFHDSTELLLSDVRHVPELKRKLISLGAVDNIGCTFESGKEKLTVAKGSLVVMRGILINGLHLLLGKTIVKSSAHSVKHQDNARLWHLRLGHIRDSCLQELRKQGLIDETSCSSLEFCDECIKGKTTRVKYSKPFT